MKRKQQTKKQYNSLQYVKLEHSINRFTCEDSGLFWRNQKETNNAKIAKLYAGKYRSDTTIIHYNDGNNLNSWSRELPFKPPELPCVWSKVVIVNFAEENRLSCRDQPMTKGSEQRHNNRCPAHDVMVEVKKSAI